MERAPESVPDERVSPASFEVLVPPPADGSSRARLGRLTLPHGVVETPQFMPVGTNATVKALSPDDLRDAGATHHPGQHLPPLPAAGPRAHRPPGRAAQVHGLGSAHAHRLGRVPGRVDGRAAQDRRRRRHLPEPPRRLVPPLHAGALDRRPGGARRRHRGRLRPAGAAGILVPRSRRGSDSPNEPLGRTIPSGPHPAGSGAVRHHPGRPGPGVAGRVHASHDRACRSTASASAAWPATRPRPSARRRWTWRWTCSGTIRGRGT